jgi:hypothetical protein
MRKGTCLQVSRVAKPLFFTSFTKKIVAAMASGLRVSVHNDAVPKGSDLDFVLCKQRYATFLTMNRTKTQDVASIQEKFFPKSRMQKALRPSSSSSKQKARILPMTRCPFFSSNTASQSAWAPF